MSRRTRKFALTAHIVASVGWLGAVAAFMALAIAGLVSDDLQTARSAYVAMEAIGRYVLVPFALASLLTGLVKSLTTKWGLVRHYWVIFKLAINLIATGILLLYLQTLEALARIASAPTASTADLRDPSPLLHSTAALLLLLLAAGLSVYKPQGVTGRGRRWQARARPAS